MKAYASFFKLRLMTGLQYRTAAIAGIATQFFWGFMMLMIYEAFYKSAPAAQTFTYQQLVTYVWLQQSFLAFIVLWFRDSDLFNLITGGNIAYELCRPLRVYSFWYVKLLAQRLSSAALRFAPILLVAFLLPQPYRMILPPSAAAFFAFLAVLFLGVLIIISISMLVYIMTMITMSATGSMLIFAILGDFMSGMVIPVPLMPAWLRNIAYALPFRLYSDLPFRIYSGNIGLPEALQGILLQIIWLTALLAIGAFFLNRTLKKVVIQGG